MALSIAELDAITHKYIQPKLHDNIFDTNPYLNRLVKSGSYVARDGGTYIEAPLNYATVSSAGWFSGTDTLSTTPNELITNMQLGWKSCYAAITISHEEELKNSGASAVLNLLKAKAQIAEKTLKDNMGTAIYNDGTTAKALVGLRAIINTTSTVGSISQTDNAFWQGNVDSSSSTLTLSLMNGMFLDCTIDNEQPSVIMTTRTLMNSFYSLLQPAQRFVDSESARAGFSSLLFNGKALLSDSHCPANHMFFINENNMLMFYHPQRDFYMKPYEEVQNQEIKLSRIIWMGAFGSTNNRLHGKFSALTA